MDTMPGRNGGTLTKQKKGEPPPPGAGRPPKSDILTEIERMMEGDGYVVIEGDLLDENDKPTGKKVKVRATIPNSESTARAWLAGVKKGNPQLLAMYLDRKYGKPKQAVEHSGPDGAALFPQFANQPIQVEILKTTE
jgi:hypothetical protein